MDEEAPIRAIVIGVSVLLAIATISAVLMYYNTAKQMASNVGRGQDFASNYEKSIQDILLKGTYTVSDNNYITGADVKNLLNYFYNNEDVWVSVYGIKVIEGHDDSYTPNIASSTKVYDYANLKNYDKAMKDISNNQRFKITKYVEDEFLEVGKKGTYILIDPID